jgi:DNA repair protein SbcD/Mre11
MRILHTADWHLCDKLGRNDRTHDLRKQVERVAKLCEERTVDVLLVAGDVFSEQASVADMTDAFAHLRTVFGPFFARGGTILAVTGNHDRDNKLNLVRSGMLLASPNTAANPQLTPGRMYLFNRSNLVKLGGVQFMLVPYPYAGRFGLNAKDYPTREEENTKLRALVAESIQGIHTHKNFDATLPTVLVAHLHVYGAETHTLYKMNPADDHCFAFADLAPHWAYGALGHIHKPQCLNGAEHVRYPGTLDRLDFGEPAGQQGVVYCEVNGTERVTPEWIPFEPTPFLDLRIDDLDAELPLLAERYPDPANTIAKFTLTPSATLSRDEAVRQLRRHFPRWMEIRWNEPQAGNAAPKMSPKRSVAESVREYLAAKLEGDGDKQPVLDLADRFLAEEVQ